MLAFFSIILFCLVVYFVATTCTAFGWNGDIKIHPYIYFLFVKWHWRRRNKTIVLTDLLYRANGSRCVISPVYVAFNCVFLPSFSSCQIWCGLGFCLQQFHLYVKLCAIENYYLLLQGKGCILLTSKPSQEEAFWLWNNSFLLFLNVLSFTLLKEF